MHDLLLEAAIIVGWLVLFAGAHLHSRLSARQSRGKHRRAAAAARVVLGAGAAAPVVESRAFRAFRAAVAFQCARRCAFAC